MNRELFPTIAYNGTALVTRSGILWGLLTFLCFVGVGCRAGIGIGAIGLVEKIGRWLFLILVAMENIREGVLEYKQDVSFRLWNGCYSLDTREV